MTPFANTYNVKYLPLDCIRTPEPQSCSVTCSFLLVILFLTSDLYMCRSSVSWEENSSRRVWSHSSHPHMHTCSRSHYYLHPCTCAHTHTHTPSYPTHIHHTHTHPPSPPSLPTHTHHIHTTHTVQRRKRTSYNRSNNFRKSSKEWTPSPSPTERYLV